MTRILLAFTIAAVATANATQDVLPSSPNANARHNGPRALQEVTRPPITPRPTMDTGIPTFTPTLYPTVPPISPPTGTGTGSPSALSSLAGTEDDVCPEEAAAFQACTPMDLAALDSIIECSSCGVEAMGDGDMMNINVDDYCEKWNTCVSDKCPEACEDPINAYQKCIFDESGLDVECFDTAKQEVDLPAETASPSISPPVDLSPVTTRSPATPFPTVEVPDTDTSAAPVSPAPTAVTLGTAIPTTGPTEEETKPSPGDVEGYEYLGYGTCQDKDGQNYPMVNQIYTFSTEECGQFCDKFRVVDETIGTLRGYHWGGTGLNMACTCMFDQGSDVEAIAEEFGGSRVHWGEPVPAGSSSDGTGLGPISLLGTSNYDMYCYKVEQGGAPTTTASPVVVAGGTTSAPVPSPLETDAPTSSVSMITKLTDAPTSMVSLIMPIDPPTDASAKPTVKPIDNGMSYNNSPSAPLAKAFKSKASRPSTKAGKASSSDVFGQATSSKQSTGKAGKAVAKQVMSMYSKSSKKSKIAKAAVPSSDDDDAQVVGLKHWERNQDHFANGASVERRSSVGVVVVGSLMVWMMNGMYLR